MGNLKAVLVLEDGTFWKGRGFGFPSRVIGEIVFNTGMVGYTESFTDPSYKGQILVCTYPLIGNYGVPEFKLDEYGLPIGFESDRIQISGLVVQEACKNPSHPTSKMSIHEWFLKEGIPGIEDVDTREITKRLRTKGVMMAALEVSENEISEDKLFNELKNTRRYDEISFKPDFKGVEHYGNSGELVALIDCGVKLNIIRSLVKRGMRVVRLPYNVTLEELLSYKPKGVVISNGPGNPKNFVETIELIKDLRSIGMPMLGICLGNQLIALSYGADTFKMKYGHRGQNKPCIYLDTKNSYVTSQNHGYAVDPNSLKNTTLKPWWINADDSTIEGLIDIDNKVIAVQFHPEANPGPVDTAFVFDIFKDMVRKNA